MSTLTRVFALVCALATVPGCLTSEIPKGPADREAEVTQTAAPGGVTVTERAVGQQAVSWTADPAAVKYYVFQAAAGGPMTFIASVLDSLGGTPATSYIAVNLTGGVNYCYSIESVYFDGTMSGLGAPGCGIASGIGGTPSSDVKTLTMAPGGGFNILGAFSRDSHGGVFCSSAGAWYVPIPLHTGDRVQAVTIAGSGDGAVDAVIDVIYVTKSGAGTIKATASVTDAPVPFTDTTATPTSPTALADGDICLVRVTPNALGFGFNNLRVVYDGP